MGEYSAKYLFEGVLLNLVQQGKDVEIAIESAIKAKNAYDKEFNKENTND